MRDHDQSDNLKPMYELTMIGLALSFALVTLWPYVWVYQSFDYQFGQDSWFSLEAFTVFVAWVIVVAIAFYLRKQTVSSDPLKADHARFLLHSFLKHLLLGTTLLVICAVLLVIFPNSFFRGDSMSEWMTILWISLCLASAAYMMAFDWQLLDSLRESRHAAREGQLPHSVASAVRLFKKVFWFMFVPIMLIHFVFLLFGAMFLSVLIPIVIAIKWIVEYVRIAREKKMVAGEEVPPVIESN